MASQSDRVTPSYDEIEFPAYNGLTKCLWPNKGPSPHQSIPRVYRPQVANSVLELIGDTPMVKLDRIAKAHDIPCELWAKCELFNPGGSVKDRIGLCMIEEAERNGSLKPGDTIIEATSGNTGIGLCMAAAIKGYKVILTLPEKMSGEKVNMMKVLGAQILRTPTEAAWNSPESHIGLALRLRNQIPNSHILDQYKNPANPLAHYYGTAIEIIEQTNAKLDACVLGTGTGGSATGIARRLREDIPGCRIIGVDPIGSILAEPDSLNDDKRLQSYQVEGIGYDFVPTVLDRSVIDEWVKVGDKESFMIARELLRLEALMCGGSSGSAVAGAIKWIKSQPSDIMKGKRVVVVLPDSSRNYMSRFLDDDWMVDNGFLGVQDLPNMNHWWSQQPVRVLPQNSPITVTPNTPCGQVVKLMTEKAITQVPILDDTGDILGVVSEGNLVSKLTSGRVESESSVDSVMYKRVQTVTLDYTLGYLSKLLDIHPFVLVVANQEKYNGNMSHHIPRRVVIGVVTRIDLLNYIMNPIIR